MGIFFGILFVLALITLVGHGIWVLLAAVLRGLSGQRRNPSQDRDEARKRCLGCSTIS
jgi:hypothetical protein